MLARGGTMLLAVLVVGAGLLAGSVQPAEAKMNDTTKVIIGVAAGLILADVFDNDHGRRGHNPPRHRYTKKKYNHRPSHYTYRSPGRSIHIEHRPVW